MNEQTVTFETVDFRVNAEERTISGLLLPFGVVSRPSLDPKTGKPALWTFDDGTVELPDDPSDVRLNVGHDKESLEWQVGTAASLTLTPAGVEAVFNIARTAEGDRVLALADPKVKVLKHFSAEIAGDFDTEKSDTPGMPLMRAKKTGVAGGAVVLRPAFTGAGITNVAASAAQIKENDMTTTETVETDQTSFSAADGQTLMAQVQDLATELAAMKDIQIPVGPQTANFEVREEPIYRFAGDVRAPSGFDFGEDLFAAARGDQAAFARIREFTNAEAEASANFADQPTTTGDVAGLNPSVYRPDMFLGQAPTPASPLFDTFQKGTINSVTPFYWVKLDRTNTDVGVGDHTEGTNPETRDLVVTTGATVTPVAISGRVGITREVSDQIGNPSVSGLIKIEFDRSYAIAKETKTAALLAAAAGGVTALTGAIAAGASGAVAGRAIETGLIGLQFVVDGSRFTKAFGHVDLYTALGTAIGPRYNGDTVGENLYPIINPQNRDGVTGDKYAFIDIAGYRMAPAASLGDTSAAASLSWVVDPNAVHVWASGLTQLPKLSETVAGWDIGVFGYFAGVVYDTAGLRKISYDPAA